MTHGQRDEHEWQATVSAAGVWGLAWAIVTLLLKKRIITREELQDQIGTEPGPRLRDL